MSPEMSPPAAHPVDRPGEQLGAGLQGPQERGLLRVRDARDPLEVRLELRVGVLHDLHREREQVGQHGLRHAEQTHRAHSAAQEPAEDVAAALIGRPDAIADDDERRAHVVGDDAHADVVGLERTVLPP